jgi:hypothetical protein
VPEEPAALANGVIGQQPPGEQIQRAEVTLEADARGRIFVPVADDAGVQKRQRQPDGRVLQLAQLAQRGGGIHGAVPWLVAVALAQVSTPEMAG